MAEQLKEDYLDISEGVIAEIHQVSQWDDPSALCIAYLGGIKVKKR